MVMRSPLSVCVSSPASAAGRSRSGAIASITSKLSPSTKRAAATLPSRYLAARSPRAGKRRGSSIAFAQELVEGAGALAFAALGPRRLGRRHPGVDVEMQPAFRMFATTLQEQRAGDRTRERARRRVGDRGGL